MNIGPHIDVGFYFTHISCIYLEGVYNYREDIIMENCPHCKSTPRDEELVSNLEKRLNRISGQLNGVTKMIKENRYCHDVLIQIAAIENALKEVGFILLKDHMTSCVVEDIKNNDLHSLEEAIEISKKLV